MASLFRAFGVAVALFSLALSPAGAQTAAPSPSASAPAEPTPTPGPEPVPMAEVVIQMEKAAQAQREIDAGLAARQGTDLVERELPAFSREIGARMAESVKILAGTPSLEVLAEQEGSWRNFSEILKDWRQDLTRRGEKLEKAAAALDAMAALWQRTAEEAKANQAPAEIRQNIKALLAAAAQSREALQKEQGRVLKLQNRVAREDTRVSGTLASVRQSRDKAVDRLFVQGAPPLWEKNVWAGGLKELGAGGRKAIFNQWEALAAYADRHFDLFLLQAALFAAIYGAIRGVRPWLWGKLAGREKADETRLLLELPSATAAILALVATRWIFPQPPRLFWACWGAALLAPALALLRRMLPPRLAPALYALALLYGLDQARDLAASQQLLERLMFVAEMLFSIGFLFWLVRSGRLSELSANGGRLGRTVRGIAWLSLAALGVAVLANATGFTGVGTLVGDGVLASAYLAVILYGLFCISEGLVWIALLVPPLSRLGMVRRHWLLLWRRTRRVLSWVALGLWLFFTVDFLSLRGFVSEKGAKFLAAKITLGSFGVGLENVIVCGLTIWGAFLLSRFLRFVLEEEVYARAGLSRGIPFVVSTVLHYTVLVIGFSIAVSALGFDMTKFTILAGAIGVGLGFGMQNIVNNFVSGLILLFERPIKVGDVVQIDSTTGTVGHIGIRASVIRAEGGSEVIVPNGRLIADRVTNWTLSSHQRGFEIPVSVAKGADPALVLSLLLGAAEGNPKISCHPKPQALFIKMGPATFDFELRVWTDQYREWEQLRSELTVAVHAALAEAKVTI